MGVYNGPEHINGTITEWSARPKPLPAMVERLNNLRAPQGTGQQAFKSLNNPHLNGDESPQNAWVVR